MCSQIFEGGVKTDRGVGSGKKPVDKNNTKYETEVWVPVEPTEKQFIWKGSNPFGVVCCKDAFSIHSHCKFAFCPLCVIEVREKIFATNQNGRVRGARRSRASKAKHVAIVHTTGNNKEKHGGVCGHNVLKGMLTVDYVEQNSGYLKCKNENKVGAENIAVHYVYCGIKL